MIGGARSATLDTYVAPASVLIKNIRYKILFPYVPSLSIFLLHALPLLLSVTPAPVSGIPGTVIRTGSLDLTPDPTSSHSVVGHGRPPLKDDVSMAARCRMQHHQASVDLRGGGRKLSAVFFMASSDVLEWLFINSLNVFSYLRKHSDEGQWPAISKRTRSIVREHILQGSVAWLHTSQRLRDHTTP